MELSPTNTRQINPVAVIHRHIANNDETKNAIWVKVTVPRFVGVETI